jgi:hypothetical protein
LGCVQGAFAGNAVGAIINNLVLSEITQEVVEQALNLEMNAVRLQRGQIEE